MWEHAATQENLARLRQRGVHIVEPDSGYLACGMTGAGRLAANETVVAAVMDVLHATAKSPASNLLAGETVLITAGPTREPIDPVRYIGNRSSGKMGYALAEAALNMGAGVILVTGPTSLKPPAAAKTISVTTAEEMRNAVMAQFSGATIVIKAAAVADYKAKEIAKQKIKRGPAGLNTLELEPTADIVAELAKSKQREGKIIVGFAAETENVLENGRKKLLSKSLDAIVVNDVSAPGVGFDSDRNAVTILSRDEAVNIPERSKSEIAKQILNFIAALKQKRSNPQPVRSR
jgi:phosphopantothenoylcysteine decarboxylase/phosphopantothenate--cysteine ligase